MRWPIDMNKYGVNLDNRLVVHLPTNQSFQYTDRGLNPAGPNLCADGLEEVLVGAREAYSSAAQAKDASFVWAHPNGNFGS